jgi:hypothetical protein
MPLDQLTAEPTELLRTMIRNACVSGRDWKPYELTSH